MVSKVLIKLSNSAEDDHTVTGKLDDSSSDPVYGVVNIDLLICHRPVEFAVQEGLNFQLSTLYVPHWFQTAEEPRTKDSYAGM